MRLIKMPNNRLLQYTTLSAVFLACGEKVNAQIQYVDIDPDVVRDIDGPLPHFYILDMDGDGILDMHFRVALDPTNVNGFGYSHIKVAPFWHNSLGGVLGSVYTTQIWDVPVGMAYRLKSDDEISDASPFFSFENAASSSYYLNAFFGVVPSFENQENFWEANALPYFIGVRFAIDSEAHYGWIRCTVENDFRKLILHDYAYNLTPGASIVAGNIIDAISQFDENKNTPKINTTANNLIITLKEPTQGIKITLLDIAGKTVYQKHFSGSIFNIPLADISSGIIIVHIINEDQIHSGKIFVE